MNNNYLTEATKITNYLLAIPLQNQEQYLYSDAMDKFQLEITKVEKCILNSMLKSKWRMALLDSALAIKKPQSVIRRKIFIMTAILEASPNYTNYFLPRNFSFAYYFKLAYVGTRALFKILIGLVYLKIIEIRCK